MNQFIVLHVYDAEVTFQTSHIVSFFRDPSLNYTKVFLVNGKEWSVQETPDEIRQLIYGHDKIDETLQYVIDAVSQHCEETQLYAYVCYDVHRLPVYITLNESQAVEWCKTHGVNIYQYTCMKVNHDYLTPPYKGKSTHE